MSIMAQHIAYGQYVPESQEIASVAVVTAVETGCVAITGMCFTIPASSLRYSSR